MFSNGGYDSSLNANDVTGMVGNQMMQDPQKNAELQMRLAQEQDRQKLGLMQEAARFQGQQGNQLKNLSTQRQMAVNAQQLAAQNVANQLSQLGQARAAGANAIQGAMQSVAGLF